MLLERALNLAREYTRPFKVEAGVVRIANDDFESGINWIATGETDDAEEEKSTVSSKRSERRVTP